MSMEQPICEIETGSQWASADSIEPFTAVAGHLAIKPNGAASASLTWAEDAT